jgi:hypothetical protein
MYDNNDFGKSVSEEQAEFEDSDIWTDQLEGIPVGQSLDNAEDILAHARTEAHDEPDMPELRPTRAQERQGQRDYDWQRDPDLDHPHGMTLAAEERMLGREQEMKRQRETGRKAAEAGVERARKAREDPHVRGIGKRLADYSETPELSDTDQSEGEVTDTDPREGLAQQDLAAVNKLAADLRDELGEGADISRASLARCIAAKVARGTSPVSAALSTKRSLQQIPGVKQPLGSIDQWNQWEATVEATVTTLFSPKENQRQAGVLKDDSGETVLFTIWLRSGTFRRLHVGDTVRLERAKVNVYQGDTTLAVTGDTDLRVLERNADGDAPAAGRQSEARVAPWSVDADDHEWVERLNTDDIVEATLGGEPSEDAEE